MQNILDRTQESLAEASASLARNAHRQQRLYFATIGVLIGFVVISAALLGALAVGKQVEYLRAVTTEDASSVSMLLHRGASFLKRTELTVRSFQETPDSLDASADIQQQIRRSGVAVGYSPAVNLHYDLLVGEATRNAWQSRLGTQLWRLGRAADVTLTTMQVELPYQALLIGLDEDYAAILPALEPNRDAKAPSLQPALIGTLRAVLVRGIEAKTGGRKLLGGERFLIGPYVDPLQGVRVMYGVSAYRASDGNVTLISIAIPVEAFLSDLHRQQDDGMRLLLTPQHDLVIASPPVKSLTVQQLQELAAKTPAGQYAYSRAGVVFVELVTPGYGQLVNFVPWRTVFGALAWQLSALGGLGLLLIAAMMCAARFWGVRLLRKWHEEAARALESETINHILVNATPVGLCIVRRRNFTILTSNQLARELLHVDRRAILPDHIAAAFKERHAHRPGAAESAKVAEFLVPALPGQRDTDGVPILQISYAAARYVGDDVLFCAILDVTARHQLARELRAAQLETEAMMRAQTNFFAAMSHEIRTPLNALLGNLELLSRSAGLDGNRPRLRAVGVAADGLRRIVNDILDFSKIGAGKMKLMTESFRPIEDLESIALSYAPLAADRPLRFYAHLSPSLDQPMTGDRARIVQIFNNLLSNAFKFTSSGKITLSAHIETDLQDRSVLKCRVSDSGIGMDSALLARLFNPFVQAESSASSRFGGTGLGLSISARLCELMGGKIEVESVPGLGSVFTVSIPLAAPPGGRVAPAPRPSPRGNVLVLCQETESGKLLEEVLGRAGWIATCVVSLVAAERWLGVNRPALTIVTGEYGIEAINVLRARQPGSVVWVTRMGPHRPAARGDGVLEVTEFSHAAFRAALELAASGQASGAASLEEAADPHLFTPDPVLRGLRVLVAEDNPLNQTLITEQLTALGCLPSVVGDGRQALAALPQTNFDIVLTDIHMPIMDGYALVSALRVAFPDLPVLAYSAVTGLGSAQDWRARGFTEYIAKPASLSQLQDVLLRVGVRAGVRAAMTGGGADAEPGEAAVPPDEHDGLDPEDKARYLSLLKQHMRTDLPRLVGIIESHDADALRNWAHSSGGAFLVVREMGLAAQCRELLRLSDQSGDWNTPIEQRAIALHEALRAQFGIDEASLQ